MKKITMLTLTIAAAVMSAQVMAADTIQNYNGSFCDASTGTDAGKVNKSYGGLVNASAVTVLVSCPVVVDEVVTITFRPRLLVGSPA